MLQKGQIFFFFLAKPDNPAAPDWRSGLSLACEKQRVTLAFYIKWFFSFFIKLIRLGVGFLNGTGAEIGY